MTDRLDDLLFSIGEEQNGRVDFDQMYADLLQKQKEEEKNAVQGGRGSCVTAPWPPARWRWWV